MSTATLERIETSPIELETAPQNTLEFSRVRADAQGRHLWTRDQFLQAHESGFFGRDSKVELIGGEVFYTMTMKLPHYVALGKTLEAIQAIFSPAVSVMPQAPLHLNENDYPEPDIAVLFERFETLTELPTRAQLVIEIADETLAKDRKIKVPLYAQAQIPEYWIVNLVENCVEVFRLPAQLADGSFICRSTLRLLPEETLAPLAAPENLVRVGDLLA